MTNDEIQKVMEFIIKRQESFSGNMEQFSGNMEQFSENMERFSDKLERMRELHEERLAQLERAAVNLYNTVEGLGKTQNVLMVKMIELAEAQAHTDRRLNALIDIVQQGRGGTPEA
ncbi:MAG TPA: hypothetical protein VF586_09410 [Pyrinomonadaceae bacterium]|jgi:septal ring factor EnvC (AmiA/AmiB activator)